MYTLQTTVEVNGASFGIREKGDFRMVLDCFTALNDKELSETERLYACMIIFYEDFNDIEDIFKHKDIFTQLRDEMFLFFNQGEENVKSNTNNHRLVDWDKDSNLICSAINNVTHQEIRSLDYLHWWTFMGYYMSIGDCPLATIITLRHKIVENEKLEKHEKKFIQQNPEYFNRDMRSNEQKEVDEYIRKLWSE